MNQVCESSLSVGLCLSELTLIEKDSSDNYSNISIYSHNNLGKVLVIDGEIQHIEFWTHLYHETIVHLPIAFTKSIKSVLILGGGDFFAAQEVLKYETIEEVVMIDHDPKIVGMMLKYYSHARDVIKDKRFKLIINDAFKEIENVHNQFDLLINDSVDLVNYSNNSGINLFFKLSSKVKNEGLCVDLIYRHLFESETLQRTLLSLKEKKLFSIFSLVTVPEYPGILHLLVIWSKNRALKQNLSTPINSEQKRWINNQDYIICEYFNPAFLKYYLYLPPYVKRKLNESENN